MPRIIASLVLTLLLTASGWCQTDAEGRALAWQLYEAHSAGASAGNQSQFEALFMRNPNLTKRAFVSTMEYATEIYQQDMEGAGEALQFAHHLASLIAQRMGDQTPATLMQRLMAKDASVMADFSTYAVGLFPGYASGPAGAYGPGGQHGPGTSPGYGPANVSQGHDSGNYGPSTGPGAYSDSEYDEDEYGPGTSPYGPGTSPYGPGTSPYGPGTSPYGPGTSPYGPGASPYGPGTSPYGPGTSPYGPGASPYGPGTSPYGPGASPYGPGASPHGPGTAPTSDPFRPSNATGGPQKEAL